MCDNHNWGRHDHGPGREACLKSLLLGSTCVDCRLDRLEHNQKHLMNVRRRVVGPTCPLDLQENTEAAKAQTFITVKFLLRMESIRA